MFKITIGSTGDSIEKTCATRAEVDQFMSGEGVFLKEALKQLAMQVPMDVVITQPTGQVVTAKVEPPFVADPSVVCSVCNGPTMVKQISDKNTKGNAGKSYYACKTCTNQFTAPDGKLITSPKFIKFV